MRRHAKVLLAITVVCSFFATSASSAFADYAFEGTFAGARGEGAQCPEPAPGALCVPGRAAVEQSTGNLFVVDSGNDRVQVFAPNGAGTSDFLTQFGAAELSAPWGIAIDENAGQTYVYVADAGNEEIVKYDSDEAATPSFTVDPDFTSPAKGAGAGQVEDFHAALAIDPTTHDLLVADNANKRIARFEADGTPDGSFDGAAGAGSPGAFAGPIDVAVNSTGDVYVIDANGDIANQGGTSRALRYSSAGAFKASLSPVGERERVAVLAINLATDEVAVSGSQDAVYESGPPPFVAALGIFDAADNSLASLAASIDAKYDTVSGIAFDSSTKRFYVALDEGFWMGNPFGAPQIQAFADVEPAQVEIGSADGVEAFSATLRGQLNPEGSAVQCLFEYSTDLSFSERAPCADDPGRGTAPVAVHAEISGLAPDTPYNFRLVAAKGPGPLTVVSAVAALTTEHADRPSVFLDAPDGIGAKSVNLHGRVNPLGNPASYRFEYRRQGDPDWIEVPGGAGDLAASGDPVSVQVALGGLEFNTAYEARLSATNGAGVTDSTIEAFSTVAVAPEVETRPAGVPTESEVRLGGFVNPNNAATTYGFEYGETEAYGKESASAPAVLGSESQFEVLQITGLQPETTYHFRLVATNVAGTTVGRDRIVTTDGQQAYPPVHVDDIPRPRGPNPAGRAYELVNFPEKSQSPVLSSYLAPGGRVLWTAQTGAAGAQSGGTTVYLADRSEGGWSSQLMSPPRSFMEPTTSQFLSGFSPDLSTVLLTGVEPSIIKATPGRLFLYGSSGFQKALHTFPIGEVPGTLGYSYSNDLSHLLSASNLASLDPRDTNEANDVYDYGAEPPTLISLLPGGVVADCGVPPFTGFGLGGPGGDSQSQNWISQDGAYAYFLARGDGCSDALRLYRRDLSAQTTSAVSSPPLGGLEGDASFVQAATNGSWALFSTATRLAPEDLNQTRDVYRWQAGGGVECLSCIVPDASVSEAIASADGEYTYFSSPSRLGGEGIAGEANLYSLHAGKLSFVGPVDGLTGEGLDIAVSAEGGILLFQSSRDGVTADQRVVADQYYRYDPEADSLSCLSCKPGAASAGIGSAQFAMSADGQDIAFSTSTALVDVDSNSAPDIYEWHNGELGLISDGLSPHIGKTLRVWGISPDGRDLLFVSTDRLTSEVRESSSQLYDARVAGGFEPPEERPACSGDGCQGQASPRPTDPEIPSAQPAAAAKPSTSTAGTRCAKRRKSKPGHGREKAPERNRQRVDARSGARSKSRNNGKCRRAGAVDRQRSKKREDR